jgi:hypothetical protein
MSMIKIKAWLDSGANVHSCRWTDFEIEEAEWIAMSEDERDEYAKEVAWDRMDWGWVVEDEK